MSYSSEVLADSPLAYYRLGDASGTTMTDDSGNGRDGTYSGVTLGATGLLTGDADTAGSYNATTSQASVADAAWMDVTTAFTIEAWINTPDPTVPRPIADRDLGSGRVYLFRVYQGKLEFITSGGSVGVVFATSTASISANTTYHVAATFDGSNIRLYINGSLDKTVAASGSLNNASTSPLTVGCSYSGSGSIANLFSGTLDEVAYYGSVLSGTRLAAHYTAGTTAPGIDGTFDVDIPVPVASFTGSYSPPDETGTFDVDLPVPVPAFTGTYAAPPTGSFAVVLPVPEASFAGTYDGSLAGTFDAVLPVATAEFTGTYTPPPISGTMGVVLPLPVVEFTGLAGAIPGSFGAVLPLPTVEFAGVYGGPYPTDTSNESNGRRRGAFGTVTVTYPADVLPPGTELAHKVDKAIAYPTPTMVNGRPT